MDGEMDRNITQQVQKNVNGSACVIYGCTLKFFKACVFANFYNKMLGEVFMKEHQKLIQFYLDSQFRIYSNVQAIPTSM